MPVMFYLIAFTGSLLHQAPVKARADLNPYAGQEGARRAGAKLYRRECAACHGREGQGIGKAPPLATRLIRTAGPGTVQWVLRNGSVFHGMPSFSRLPEQQRWQIVTYLQSVSPAVRK